jgi:hypothetical protein
MRQTKNLTAMLAIALSLAGCVTSQNSIDTIATAEDPDLAWLAGQLTESGVFVLPRSSVTHDALAIDASRFVLDGQDVIEAFHYENAEQAADAASRLAGINPDLDVYRNQQLVVIRTSRSAGVPKATLAEILGPTI